MSTLNLLGAIGWQPEIRGILVAALGITIFMGSVYLLLSTNIGLRNGFLVALAGWFGWMSLMGGLWWVSGDKGMQGRQPSWQALEINYDRSSTLATEVARDLISPEELPSVAEILEEPENADILDELIANEGDDFADEIEEGRVTLTELLTLSDSELPVFGEDGDLVLSEENDDWELLREDDNRRGDAASTAGQVLIDQGVFTASDDFIVEDVFHQGGRLTSDLEHDEHGVFEQAWDKIESIINFKPRTEYAVVTVANATDEEAEPGQPPPILEHQPGTTRISVIMVRNQGNLRVVPAIFTGSCLLVFLTSCWMLHTRDRRILAMRAAHEAGAGA